MGKYINTENLLAEIEKRRKQRVEVNERINKGEIYTETEDDFNRALARYGNRLVYQELFEIICFIEFLQQEQPEVDLENYLENYFKGWYIEEEIGLTKPDGWSCIVDDLKDIARHFYELGLNARKEEGK